MSTKQITTSQIIAPEELLTRIDVARIEKAKLLYLGGKSLTALPHEIGQLISLEWLLLQNNFFGQIPAGITLLLSLRVLVLSNNGLTHLSDEISKLNELRQLDLSNNKILGLSPRLGDLRKLHTLNLSNNGIKSLPYNIGKLRGLKWLDLQGNQIKHIPAEIGTLKNLKFLNLSRNKLLELPNELLKLTSLEELSLSGNRLRSIPAGLEKLSKLRYLDLRNNPLPIPPELLAKTTNPSALFRYLLELEGGKDRPLNETKLILVGQGSVGKTSLVEQLLHGTFDHNQNKTEGISITQWQIEKKTKKILVFSDQPRFSNQAPQSSSIRLNIWDFGGQEIMHATHQFFLTKRSLYLLVLDARLTQEENRVEYWLKIIQSFGGESPVLIVGNKTDQHPLDIDGTGLQKKYPNIVRILETSAATGAGISALKAEIAKQVDALPHVRDPLPEAWFTVKSKLEQLGRDKNFITQVEYRDLCRANEVTNETSQHTLIGFLHDLGLVLYFQDEPRLEDLGILNPQWVTNGVYKILNSHELFQNQGRLTLSILNKTLDLPEYPRNQRLFIVDMMKKFDLCYDIEPDKSFLVPDLLQKDELYTGEWDDALAFQYHYNVLPTSIISRFIVRMNTFIHKNTIWRSGVVLKRGNNNALVKADIEDRKIFIWVNGQEDTRRDLLALIRGEFDAIHQKMVKIEVLEKVPLPNAPEAVPVDLTFLRQMASEGRESLPVQMGNRIIDLLVKEVLSKIEKDSKSSPASMIINIQGNVYGSIGNNNTVNFIQRQFEPIYEAIEESSRDTAEKQDLVAEVDEIRGEVVKGDEVNESFLSRRLRNLKKMAPDIADVALSALTGPSTAISTVVKKVARKIKTEGKKT